MHDTIHKCDQNDRDVSIKGHCHKGQLIWGPDVPEHSYWDTLFGTSHHPTGCGLAFHVEEFAKDSLLSANLKKYSVGQNYVYFKDLKV